MALATLTIDINARLANIERDLGRATHIAEKNGQKMEAAFAGARAAFVALGAALGAGAFVAGIKSVIDGADELAKASQKYGIAVEKLSALQYAGGLSDVSLESIGKALKKLSVNMLDTAAGTGEARDAFKAMGISVTDAGGQLKTSDQVLGELADKFAIMEEGAGKTALAAKIMGERLGPDMLPLLNQGAKGLAAMTKEAEQLGVVVGGDLAKKSEEFNDNLTRLSTVADAFKISIAQEALPVLGELLASFVQHRKETAGLTDDFSLLGETLKAVVVFFGNVAFVLQGVGREIGGISAQVAALASGDFKGFSNIGKLMKEDAVAARKDLDDWEKRIMTAGRGTANALGDTARRVAAPSLPSKDKKKTERDDELRQMQELGREYEKLWESAEKYTAGLDVQIEKGRALTQSEQLLLEVERQLPAEWAASIKPLLDRADAQEKAIKNAAEAKRLYEETRTPEENLAAAQIRLNELLDAGAISWDTYARAVFAAQDAYDAALEKTKKTTDEMTEFAKQAARNMQDAMADGFFNIMQGKFDDLAGNFKQTIDRMVANLLASQLMNFLTGDFGKTGQMGGALGNIFGSLFGGARAAGGPVSRGSAYLVGERGPELFVPRQSGNIVPNGGGMTVVNNFTVSQPADRRTQEQIAALAGASIQTAMARGA